MQKTIAFTLAIVISGSALAESPTDIKANTPYSAYLQDGRGVIVRSGAGLCWRTNYWTPADAVPGCDGDLVPPIIAKAIAPPIVQTQEPTPALEHLPPPPAPCNFSMTLASDQTFSFNSSTLSPAAKTRLETQFRSKLASCGHVDKIIVTGYTDRLGSDSYNQILSESRASIVAEYLNGMGVTSPIDLRGMGKQNELVSCNDVKAHKKLIDCLAPNRRVEIDVRGTVR